MDVLAQVLTVIETLTKLEPVFVSTWANLKPFAESLFAQFKGATITTAEQTALESAIDGLFARLQIPLPSAQPGDPDFVKPTT